RPRRWNKQNGVYSCPIKPRRRPRWQSVVLSRPSTDWSLTSGSDAGSGGVGESRSQFGEDFFGTDELFSVVRVGEDFSTRVQQYEAGDAVARVFLERAFVWELGEV